jgi:CHAT domain-containing protein
VGKNFGIGWKISKNSIERWGLPETNLLSERVSLLTNDLSQGRVDMLSLTKLSKQLLPNIAYEDSMIYIAPDGILSNFPFHVLPIRVNSKKKFLIQSSQVTMIPSITTLVNNKIKIFNNEKLLALSGPILNNNKITNSSSTDNEIIQISEIWPYQKKSILSGSNNLIDFLNIDLPDYKYIHFATHAKLDYEIPESSGLAFLNKNKIEYLSLGQIYNLKLNSQLVTMSACDSASGKNIIGEGVFSLARGFLYAGSESVIASIWKVPDKPVKIFMDHFYMNLGETLDSSLALTRTQSLASQGVYGRVLRNPQVWAAFNIISKGN